VSKLVIGVIFGGRSGEHEVSLMSARSVMKALDRSKYEVLPIGVDPEGRWYGGEDVLEAFESRRYQDLTPVVVLAEPGRDSIFALREGKQLEPISRLDVAFPLVHGSFGEDGTLQGLLELADVAYVGAGVLASSVGMDKGVFKTLMRASGIPVVDWTILPSAELSRDMDRILDRAQAVAPYPLFTKPANLGSSVGVTKCRSRSDLTEGLMDAARYDRRILVERGLEAREIEVSVLGNEDPEASVPGEIIPSDEFYSYRAKYVDDASQLLIPAPIDPQIAEEARRLAVQAFRVVDGAGMARVDFLLEKGTGDLYLSELNTIPGFTRISMYPKLWDATGIPYPALMDRLIDLALARQAQKDALTRRYGEPR
jgi:D-alanine-D-alanine ligase